MQRLPRILVLPAVALVIVLGATAALAQTDQDQVKALVDGLRQALAKGDVDAMGPLMSDSGFVAALELTGQVDSYDKNQFLAFLKTGLPGGGLGDAFKVDDVTVELHHTVAFINAKLSLPDQSPDQHPFLSAVAFRDLGKWQLCALTAANEAGKVDDASAKALTDRMSALPDAVKQGDVKLLENGLDDDHFLLCFVDPSLELRWTSSKATLVGMIQGLLGMVTINQSRLEVARTQVGQDLAVVDGSWLLDIPDFGQTTSALRAYAVKHDDAWKIIAIAGGPPG
jgi:ketosteroid isomerase-like protein